MHEMLRQQLGGVWPDNPQEEFVWPIGPIAANLPDFRVMRIGPRQLSDPWIYATVGAFEISGVEFVLMAESEDVMHVETLSIITHFHQTRRLLAEGSVVNLGRPWIDGADTDHVVVTRAEIEGLTEFTYLQLTQITREQAALVKAKGLAALEIVRV